MARGWSLGTCISNQFVGDAAAAGPRDPGGNPRFSLPFCVYVHSWGERRGRLSQLRRGTGAARRTVLQLAVAPQFIFPLTFFYSRGLTCAFGSGNIVPRTHHTLGGPTRIFSFLFKLEAIEDR